jgi:hypothetical protein
MMGRGNATRGPVLRLFLWRAGIPIVALAGGFLGGYVTLPWGLVTPLFVVWPLALGFGALLAALGASWTGTLLSPDGTRTRLSRVVLASEVVAAALALAFSILPILVPLIFILAFGAGAIALVASWSAWSFRGQGGRIGLDGGLVLILATAVLTLNLLSFDGTVIRAVFGSLSVVAGVGLSVSVGIAAVALGVVLARRRFRGPEKRLGKDAAVTLGLAGLPAPVFFGAYYTASFFGLTSG